MKEIRREIDIDKNSPSSDATLILQNKGTDIILRMVLFDDSEYYTITEIKDKKTIYSKQYTDFFSAKESKYGNYFYSLGKMMANSKT